MRIPVKKHGLCETCCNRKTCPKVSKRTRKCAKDEFAKATKQKTYRPCKAEVKRLRAETDADAEAWIAANLKVTDRSQIKLTDKYEVIYAPKPGDVRRFNSRSGTTVRVSDDGLTLMRYCENCGRRFHTTEHSRRLCDGCHDEICELLHVNYAEVPSWKRARKGGAR